MIRALTLSLSLLLTLALGLTPVRAQACSAEASQALALVAVNCASLGDNAACYGHNGVQASFSEPVTFNAPGNVAPLPPLQNVSTLPYNAAIGEWGIAVLRLDAQLAGMLPGQSATLLLMGDVQVSAAAGGAPMQAFNVRVGIGQSQCAGLPPSSITINGPQRGNLELTVNGASMRVGSNITIREAGSGDQLRFIVTAGRVEVNGGPRIPVGYAVNVALDDEGEILMESWGEPEVMSFEELGEFEPLEELPEDVLGEAYPLPEEDELALIGALDYGVWLEMDPYLAIDLAEDWAANGYLPEDFEGASLHDLETYLLDNLDYFELDSAFLDAMGDSFGLASDDLFALADEYGFEYIPGEDIDAEAAWDAFESGDAGDDTAIMDDGTDDGSADQGTGDTGSDSETPPDVGGGE